MGLDGDCGLPGSSVSKIILLYFYDKMFARKEKQTYISYLNFLCIFLISSYFM